MASLAVPESVPSPIEDCENLRKSVQGLGTDENAIISILGHRDAFHIGSIRETYQQLYNESLIDRLHGELSGDFRKAVILWTHNPCERDARLANEALKGKRKGMKNLQILAEIACASSPSHLIAVRKVYCALFDCSLEEDIVSHVEMPLRKILVGIVSAYRYDKEAVEAELVNSDAAKLGEAIKRKELSSDEVVCILSTRSAHHLKHTVDAYREKFEATLTDDVKRCGNGDVEALVRVVIECIVSPERHFAEVIGRSIIGLGTDEDTLTRCIVSRAAIDMVEIKKEYIKMHKSTLERAVHGDTSGYYRLFLMTLLGASN